MSFIPSLLTTAAEVTPLLAYMDPGSGSLLLQILLGGIAGAAVAMKLFWSRIKDFFRMNKPEGREQEPESPDDPARDGVS